MAAHGDTGVLELVEQTPVDEDTVEFLVSLTYESDGDPVSGAEVLVTTDGGALTAMTAEGDGQYRGTVDFPSAGDHEVLFAVEEPAAELTVTQVIDATTTTTTAVEGTATTSPALAADHDDANSTWLLVVMAVIVIVMITIAVAFFRGRASASNRPST